MGELAEVFQWKGDAAAGKGLPGFSSVERTALEAELSDVLLYLVRLADMCGVDLSAAALAKLEQACPAALLYMSNRSCNEHQPLLSCRAAEEPEGKQSKTVAVLFLALIWPTCPCNILARLHQSGLLLLLAVSVCVSLG